MYSDVLRCNDGHITVTSSGDSALAFDLPVGSLAYLNISDDDDQLVGHRAETKSEHRMIALQDT
jgi:hypothetical protein